MVSYLRRIDWRIAEFLEKLPLKTAQFFRVQKIGLINVSLDASQSPILEGTQTSLIPRKKNILNDLNYWYFKMEIIKLYRSYLEQSLIVAAQRNFTEQRQ